MKRSSVESDCCRHALAEGAELSSTLLAAGTSGHHDSPNPPYGRSTVHILGWARGSKILRCPICGGEIPDWNGPARRVTGDSLRDAWGTPPTTDNNRNGVATSADWRVNALRECTASHRPRCVFDRPAGRYNHLLPDLLGDFGQPISIGLIGGVAAGKTLLLAAMIDQLRNNQEVHRAFGFTPMPLQSHIEQRYVTDFIEPFCRDRQQLPLTHRYSPDLTYVTMIESQYARRRFALVFFDLAGETFYDIGRSSAVPAIAQASGFIFVVDPVSALPTLVPSNSRRLTYASGFAAPIDYLRTTRGDLRTPFIAAPATVVVTKTDLIRDSDELAGKWLDRVDALDLSTTDEESCDVYSMLSGRDAKPWVYPAESFMDVTLHFASASGVDVGDQHRFPADGFGQKRAIRPLLALFAMLGIVDRRLLR